MTIIYNKYGIGITKLYIKNRFKKEGYELNKVQKLLMICMFMFVLTGGNFSEAANSDKVIYMIPVEHEVERGLEAFLDRALEAALEEGADHIVLNIDTPGGRVDAAGNIAKIIQNSPIPITAYIVNKALSAGAYIALNADQIVMAPGATMGAAGVIDSAGNAADKKMQSAWLATMVSAAELNDRDPIYAKAMADPNIDLPNYGAPKGEFLTFTSSQALEAGYAEAIVNDEKELFTFLQLDGAHIERMNVSFAEKIARFVTSPIVIPILLSVASLGLIVELYSPGFGVPGTMGLTSLGLFFYGHLVAGFAGWESILFLVAGIILILLELFLPGGILGVIGLVAIIASFFFASYDLFHMAVSLSIAFIVTTIVAILLYKFMGYRGFMTKIILKDSTSEDRGYSSYHKRDHLVGLVGEALTDLRPAGTALIENERLDVITEGTFIDKGKRIKVVKTEGVRVVVREIE
jgi:membrane-bound serine protease (ClpP class)